MSCAAAHDCKCRMRPTSQRPLSLASQSSCPISTTMCSTPSCAASVSRAIEVDEDRRKQDELRGEDDHQRDGPALEDGQEHQRALDVHHRAEDEEGDERARREGPREGENEEGVHRRADGEEHRARPSRARSSPATARCRAASGAVRAPAGARLGARRRRGTCPSRRTPSRCARRPRAFGWQAKTTPTITAIASVSPARGSSTTARRMRCTCSRGR